MTASAKDGEAAPANEETNGSDSETRESIVREMQVQIRNHMRMNKLADIIPENSKVLVIEERVPLCVALRALYEYRQPLLSIYSERIGAFVGMLSCIEVIDLFLCLWEYQNNPVFRTKLTRILAESTQCALSQQSFVASASTLPTDNGSDCAQSGHVSSGEGGRAARGRDFDFTLTAEGLNSNFDIRDDLYVSYGDEEHSSLAMASEDNDDTSSAPVESPPLWAAPLFFWIKLQGGLKLFPHISVRRSELEAALFLRHMRMSSMAVYDDESATILSFTSYISLLSHLIQTLRGDNLQPALLLSIRSFGVGTWGSDVVVAQVTWPLLEVLRLLQSRGWSAVPLVDEDEQYQGMFTRHNFLQIVNRALMEQIPIDLDLPVLYFTRNFLVSTCTHPRQQLYTFIGKHGEKLESPTPYGERVDVARTDDQPSYVGLHSAAQQVHTLIASIICSAACADEDISIREAAMHVVLSEEHRILFVDPKSRHIRGLITTTDVIHALCGEPKLMPISRNQFKDLFWSLPPVSCRPVRSTLEAAEDAAAERRKKQQKQQKQQ